MHCLQRTTSWDVLIPKWHTFCDLHVFIHYLNTRWFTITHRWISFGLQFQNISYIMFQSNTFQCKYNLNITSLNINTTTHIIISMNGQNCRMIIYDNFTIYHHMRYSHIWELNIYSNIQCKYKKNHSCNNNIQICNIKPFNVLGSPSTILGCNPNFLSNSNNWSFQYWYVWSKFNRTKWVSNLFGSLLNGTSRKKNHNIYRSHIDHVSTNAPIQQFMSIVVKTYWIIGPTINRYILHINSQIMSHNIIT